MKYSLLFLSMLAACISTTALADDPAPLAPTAAVDPAAAPVSVPADPSPAPLNEQNLFSVKLSLQSSMLADATGINDIEGELPVSIVTDSSGKILALNLGKNDNVIHRYARPAADGSVQELKSANILGGSFSPDQLQAGTYDIQVRLKALGPLAVNRRLIKIDATKLDAVNGGVLKLSYLSNLLTGSTSDLNIELQQQAGHWIAIDPKSKQAITQTTVSLHKSLFGIGLQPKIDTLDPNQIISSLQTQPIDASVNSSRLAKSSRELDHFEQNSHSLAGGKVDVQLNVQSAQ